MSVVPCSTQCSVDYVAPFVVNFLHAALVKLSFPSTVLSNFFLFQEGFEEKAYSFCGTVEYMAPEVVNRYLIVSRHTSFPKGRGKFGRITQQWCIKSVTRLGPNFLE